ncbi:P-loop containing nucleoside triphosphate hydrolase protein [Calocera cornea HHB12733]|uniref:ATP-dependent DNA helicase n=1 Tax=Calocera cornea HHB12733 TaxID=1353952 RepID=A0A165GTR6_9BASI|nr:P-loop containing nucleoside triphosphate hydrolase protein [Calocera cornea HHB12733]
MSDEFDQFDDFDDSFLQQVDAIEQAAAKPRAATAPTGKRSGISFFAEPRATTRPTTAPRSTSGSATHAPSAHTIGIRPPARQNAAASTSARPLAKPPSSDPYDLSLDLDQAALASLTQIENTFQRTGSTSSAKFQTTLYGTLVRTPPRPATETGRTTANAGPPGGGAMAPARVGPFGRANQRTKQWDRTQFAATGNRNRVKAKRKKSGRKAEEEDSGEDLEEDVEFEQFPEAVVSGACPPPPMKLVPDLSEVQEWIYPTNKPIRDYQYNIVQAALFKNTLVALPTGLGKTFIAGVVMLNYYRWFPQGKVVFVAPTKPLVSQQIKACHETCGIPIEDAVEMTGETPQAQRERYWQSKRVVYMTPQTLQNDLTREVVDPRDIILIVIDEAHKGTGNYAYATVVRHMMAKNPHFRVLALTATPGSKSDAVQEIIDSLHIGHIEIRDERSLDLKQYIHEKTMEKCVVQMGASINAIREKLIALMENTVKPLRGKDIFPEYVRLADLHPFRCKSFIDELRRKPQGKQYPWATALLMRLHKLTFAMTYLCEESVEMAYRTLLDAAGKKMTQKEGGNKLSSDSKYREVIAEIEDYRNERVTGGGPVGHPKMDKLVAVALEHFAAPEDGADHTRVMVFCQYRDCVDEIVKSLNLQQPIIRASKFVGQSSDKRGDKGMAQKDQIGMIKRFKDGEFNVLVATSIGEEGLDIGEVDLIICYDVQKSSIKMLQRIGRTGRKRDGKIVVLMAEGREEPNWDAANENYSSVQEIIIRGDQLELFDDDERLIPDSIKPTVRKQHMEIHPFASQQAKVSNKRKASRETQKPAKRRKRNDDPMRNIPDGALSGFISAATLVPRGKTSTTPGQLTVEDLDRDLEDDDDDVDITRGRLSSTPVTPPQERRKSALSKVRNSKRAKDIARPRSTSSAVEDLSRDLEDDSDDLELQQGLDDMLGQASSDIRLENFRTGEVVEISSDDDDAEQDSPEKKSPGGRQQSLARPTTSEEPPIASWLLSSDSEVERLATTHNERKSGPQSSTSAAALKTPNRIEVELSPIALSPIVPRARVDVSTPAKDFRWAADVHGNAINNLTMGPPLIPKNRVPSSDDSPFPVRRTRALHQNRNIVQTQDDDLVSRQIAQAPSSSSPIVDKRPSRRSRPRLYSNSNQFFDVEANLSGSDHGEDGDDNSEWSESDRQFIKDSPATQAVPKGEEQAMYLQGLMTQVPGRGGPRFRSGPIRKGVFAAGNGRPRRVTISSSEADPSSEANEYELGSFIVPDDESFDVDEVDVEVGMLG